VIPRAARRILIARGLRAFGDGYVSLLLPLYLLELGFGTFDVGVIATTTLLGSGLLTLMVGLRAHRYHMRSVLLAATALMAATGVGFALFEQFWPLLLIAFVGTLNPSSGDVSVFLPLEHELLSRFATDRDRTAVFARYSLVGTLLAALGSLTAAVPALVAPSLDLSTKSSLQLMFVLYGVLALLAAFVYRGLPAAVETAARQPIAPLEKSRKRVFILAGLFSLDAFGGGFVVQSMIALWLYQRFDLSLATAGTCSSGPVLSALSFLVAVESLRRSAWSTRWSSRTCLPACV
jgi:MFS family permease